MSKSRTNRPQFFKCLFCNKPALRSDYMGSIEPLKGIPIMTNWSHIVQEHGGIVWRTVHRLLGNEADEADCFQRTFVSALDLSRHEAIRNWPPLLKRLATVRALECLRFRCRTTNRLAPLAEGGVVDRKAVDPLQAAGEAELADHLRVALTKLEPLQCEVFCLAVLDDLSYQQVAEQLRLNANHVGVLLNRARASLRNLLQAHCPTPAATHIEKEEQP
jgi:RNA polymerase sigma factor (sigma-70 family)